VSYASASAEAWMSGPIVMSRDIHFWVEQLRSMNRTLQGSANLDPIEPHLSVAMCMGRLGHISLTATLRPGPDPEAETHCFRTEVDQSYLPQLIAR
jgi:hypothetical protein